MDRNVAPKFKSYDPDVHVVTLSASAGARDEHRRVGVHSHGNVAVRVTSKDTRIAVCNKRH